MARSRTRTLTELELKIMQVVWQHEEVTVGELRRAFEQVGKHLALPTIRTMLGILQKKGYVTRRPFGRGHAYRALVSAERAQKSILKDIVERAFDGSASNMVAALVKADMVSENDLEKIRRLIQQHDRGAEQ